MLSYEQEAIPPASASPLAIPPVRCMFGIKTGAFYGQEATMPASDPARQVHVGIKTGAFYGQEATMPVRCVFMVKIGAAVRVKKRPKPVSDAARQVRFGIKKVLP